MDIRPIIKTTELLPCPYISTNIFDMSKIKRMFKGFDDYTDYILFKDNKPFRAWRFDHEPRFKTVTPLL